VYNRRTSFNSLLDRNVNNLKVAKAPLVQSSHLLVRWVKQHQTLMLRDRHFSS